MEAVSSKLWLYRSLLNQAADNNAGLIGPIIVTAAGKALPDGKPNDVDTEFVTIFEVLFQHLNLNLLATIVPMLATFRLSLLTARLNKGLYTIQTHNPTLVLSPSLPVMAHLTLNASYSTSLLVNAYAMCVISWSVSPGI